MNLLDPNALKGFPDVSFDATDIPDCVTSITPKLSASAEFTMEAEIDGNMLAKLCGLDLEAGKDFTVEYSEPILVQVRCHKKKRINKKWRKRYGFKTIFRKKQLTDCVVSHDISNNLTRGAMCAFCQLRGFKCNHDLSFDEKIITAKKLMEDDNND